MKRRIPIGRTGNGMQTERRQRNCKLPSRRFAIHSQAEDMSAQHSNHTQPVEANECARCEALCATVDRHLNGAERLASPPPTLDLATLGTECALCDFLAKACAGFPRDSLVELQRNKDGVLYLTNKSSERVHLLPLHASEACISGRLITSKCDAALLRKWLTCCEDWHGAECYTPGWAEVITPRSDTDMRLIDVERRCLVDGHSVESPRYVALSYVWGKVDVTQTTRANVATLYEETGFDRIWAQLPRTIQDALKLVALLKERYLWVDSLCIVQDEAEEKHKQISRMDAIYGNAILTINAAGGSDANAGLCGVGAARDVEQLVVEYAPGKSIIAAQPILTDLADSSFWNTRAWTYQERFLSKRSVTFTDKHVFFQCQRTVWCEDLDAERDGLIDNYQMEDYLPIDWSTERNEHMYKLHYSLHVQKSTNWVEYLRTVEEYTPRMLSFESDVLKAFAGMSRVLGAMFSSPMLYGLPESLFDCALLWQPEASLTRRSLTDEYVPSWSWAGWKGPVVYEDIMPHLKMLSSELVRRTKRLVKWSRCSRDGSVSVPISSAGKMGEYLLESFEQELPQHWHVSTGGVSDIFIGTYYYHEDRPSSFFAIPYTVPRERDVVHVATPYITGKVRSCVLRVVAAASREGEAKLFNVFSHEYVWCGHVWLHRDFSHDEAEFIAISEGCTPKGEVERFWKGDEWEQLAKDQASGWYEFVNVLLIERQGGLANRVGIGKIDKPQWDRLPSTTIDLCLA